MLRRSLPAGGARDSNQAALVRTAKPSHSDTTTSLASEQHKMDQGDDVSAQHPPEEELQVRENVILVGGREFEVAPRYTDLQFLGEGAYGMVVAGTDVTDGCQYAIKKVTPLQHETFCQRTLREILILSRLKHENIVHLHNLICPHPPLMNEVYLVLNLMETDMHKLLKNLRRRNEYLGEAHRCFFLYQMMLALKYIHSANVLHRDLKPANILLNTSNCDLRICDFGLARVSDPSIDHRGKHTEYVATRWYRAPEVMVQQRAYGKEMDMWSVGCIFAEMLSNRPLFPGKNYVDQLNKILDIIGSPSADDLRAIPNERSRKYVAALPLRAPKAFAEMFPNASEGAIDLLNQLLVFNPSNRITAAEALDHPYFEDYHDPEDEPEAPEPFDFRCEVDAMPVKELQTHIYEISQTFSGTDMTSS